MAMQSYLYTPMAPDSAAVQNLISSAKATLANLSRETTREVTHSVAAACLSQDGRTFTGINIFHFSGGPCGEDVAMGAAVAAGVLPADLCLMVAVKRVNGNGDEDEMRVINPCGRCRQKIFDFNDDIEVIVVDEGGSEKVVGIKELLPYAYVWNNNGRRKKEGELERAVE